MSHVIVVVEPVPVLRMAVADALGRRGYTVYAADSAEDATERLGTGTADLVIVDARLGSDTVDLFSQIWEVKTLVLGDEGDSDEPDSPLTRRFRTRDPLMVPHLVTAVDAWLQPSI
jgi:CheY-like chemotaxis protein